MEKYVKFGNWNKFNNEYDRRPKIGHIYDEDICCPDKLRDKFDEYPSYPEQIITDSMVCEHQINQKSY